VRNERVPPPPVVVFEQRELELLIELVEHADAGRIVSLAQPTYPLDEGTSVLEKFYAERPHVPTTPQENDHEVLSPSRSPAASYGPTTADRHEDPRRFNTAGRPPRPVHIMRR
jgi:hypothetical protein